VGALVVSSGTRASLVRFGPFEADLEAEALRRDGHSVRIQQQPFQVLASLLERPGETVTREELRRRLWPDGTHVDFDHSLNTAIKKVRLALGETPESPRYVETVRGRGYRLRGPVETVEGARAGMDRPGAATRRRLPWLIAGAAAMLAIVAVMALTRANSPRRDERLPRVVPLTAYPGVEHQPSFSPDGSHVAFARRRDRSRDIYVQPVGALQPLPLTREPEVEHSPAWSPDGRWIAFIRDSAGANDRARILVKPPFAGPERLVAELPGRRGQRIWQRQIAWTPDSQRLVLSRPDDEGATWSLYLVDVTSGRMRRLTESPARDSAPAVSGDGRRLAFSRRVGDRGEIHLLPLEPDLTPAGRSRLLVGEELLREVHRDAAYMPAWTRDGREIVFAAFPRSPQLFRVDASSAARVRSIRARGDLLLDPAVCPRTGRLAYANWEGRQSIVRLDIGPGSDTPATPVSFNSTRSDAHPCFSPDGRTVAFMSTRLGGPSIWLSGPDGSGLRRLTLPAEGVWHGDHTWSPDGQWIAYAEFGPQADIHVISVLGGAPRRFTFHPAEDREPAWSPDGQWIYFVSRRDGGPRVWRKPAAGGVAERMSGAGAVQIAFSPDGGFLFARGWPNEEEVWRMPVGGGPEEVVLRSVSPHSRWCVGLGGLYFFERPLPDGRSSLFRYEFDSETTRRLDIVDDAVGAGMSVSPDERTVLFARHEEPQADLQILEDFGSE
jgi:Tol biopolymer transport system component/DNA-binding winged helix-turn-helix (wHTH) protein